MSVGIRSLWDDDALTERKAGATEADPRDPLAEAATSTRGSVATPPRSVSAFLPLLPQPDEPRPEYRPRHRHLFLNQLDGPAYDAACESADAVLVERDVTLYGESGVSTRDGWTKDAA